MKKTLFAFAVLMLFSVAGNATTISAGGPGTQPGDWTQQWQWQGTTVVRFDLFIETPGVTFAAPGISNFTNSWTATDVNSQYAYATGPADVNFYYNTNFTNPSTDPLTYDWYGYDSAGNAIDTGSAHWDGSTWSYSSTVAATRDQENSAAATPEPATFALFGGAFLGIGLITKRRRQQKQ